ncbi:MAG: EMC3/TMCO1 family protein [archaeon]|jgi:uncharacterized membrane protein (DUF106 family)|nr:EMC3/TMCO1 family protein [archaeon]
MLESITLLIQQHPLPSVIVMGILISFFISLVNYFVLDKEKMHAIKAKQKALQEEMKKHKDNPTKLMELQKEMFSHMGETFKHSMKPMLITFIPLMILFPFMRTALVETAIKGTWFWWYIGVSLVSSLFFRKLFKLP